MGHRNKKSTLQLLEDLGGSTGFSVRVRKGLKSFWWTARDGRQSTMGHPESIKNLGLVPINYESSYSTGTLIYKQQSFNFKGFRFNYANV